MSQDPQSRSVTRPRKTDKQGSGARNLEEFLYDDGVHSDDGEVLVIWSKEEDEYLPSDSSQSDSDTDGKEQQPVKKRRRSTPSRKAPGETRNNSPARIGSSPPTARSKDSVVRACTPSPVGKANHSPMRPIGKDICSPIPSERPPLVDQKIDQFKSRRNQQTYLCKICNYSNRIWDTFQGHLYKTHNMGIREYQETYENRTPSCDKFLIALKNVATR